MIRITPSAARRSAYGSLLPVGFSSIAQNADQHVQLVGQRNGDRDRALGHAVALPCRLVMLRNRIGDLGILALLQRDISPDRCLATREIRPPSPTPDRPCTAAPRAPPCPASAPTSGASSRASFISRRTRSPLRPQLLVEGDLVELGQHRLQPALLVVLPKELGVRQPRADHALIAGDDRISAISRLLNSPPLRSG